MWLAEKLDWKRLM